MDTGAYLLELQRMIAIHGSSLRAIEMAALEQRVSPSPLTPPLGGLSVPTTLAAGTPWRGYTPTRTLPVANGLLDPTFEKIPNFAAAPLLTTSWQALSSYWEARYVLDSGTDPTYEKIYLAGSRDNSDNGMNSACVTVLVMNNTGSAISGQVTVELRSKQAPYVANHDHPPYISGAFRLHPSSDGFAEVELRTTVDDTLRASSGMIAVPASDLVPVLVMAATDPATISASRSWYVVYRLRWTYTNLGHLSQRFARIYEPQLCQAWDASPVPFSPYIGRWYPDAVMGIDTRIYRSGTKTITADDGAGTAATLNVIGQIDNSGTKVVGSRQTGWGAPTGTATRSTFATSTVTLSELAERLHALIDDLTTHGLIGS
jgi:hypothetical protein